MNAWRDTIAGTAICYGLLVNPAGAQPVAQQAPPALPPPALAQPAQAPPAQAPPAQAQQPTPAPKAGRRSSPPEMAPPAKRANWEALGLRGFSVALVVGDLAGASAPDNLPAGAKKALSDMRDFLPYKSYRLLDTHWILCCSGARGAASVSGRLRGAEEDEYVFHINVRPDEDSPELGVNFDLRESTAGRLNQVSAGVPSSERSGRLAELTREREELVSRLASMRSIGREEQHPEMVKLRQQIDENRRRTAEAERAWAPAVRGRVSGGGMVLDSTFSMKVGETVVIGTSRLKGDKALIALLTAASRTGATTARESR